jgi:N-acetylglucosaminyl-diphospho-decaprenol L-rhamnosyltransferase
MDDLAVIVVSTNEARWLLPCLSTLFAHLGELRADVVVADNRSTDGTRELVEREFPRARVLTCDNRGFAHANNRALLTTNARYIVFLNPDTEVREGSFERLLSRMDASPGLGLAGVKQITPDGRVFPTIRRFPNSVRAFWEAVGSERYPLRASWLGERELDLSRYEREVECDWTSGSFMIARREALESAGYLDERFFLYSEETDLCLRIKKAGWKIRHLPLLTVLHHATKAGANPRLAAQDAFARRIYGRKHFSPVHRGAYFGALALGYAVRSVAPGRDPGRARERRFAARAALSTLLGFSEPPFGTPPPVAVAPRGPSDSSGQRNAASTESTRRA